MARFCVSVCTLVCLTAVPMDLRVLCVCVSKDLRVFGSMDLRVFGSACLWFYGSPCLWICVCRSTMRV